MLIKAIVLGIIQGLTEFIPISSSGHLIGIRDMLGWHEKWMDQTFDVSLHIGTLVALLVYYRRDWRSIIGGFFNHIFKRIPYCKSNPKTANGNIFIPIMIACIPAAMVGFLWGSFIEQSLGKWYMLAGALVVGGLIMYFAERFGKKQRSIDQMSYVDYMSIGIAQTLALFPGVSRSGITISTGLFLNLDRSSAARFSFLLSTPIIFGAGMSKIPGLMKTGFLPGEIMPMIVGFITAAVSGYLAIHFLISYLRNRSLNIFVIYRFGFAALLMAVIMLRG